SQDELASRPRRDGDTRAPPDGPRPGAPACRGRRGSEGRRDRPRRRAGGVSRVDRRVAPGQLRLDPVRDPRPGRPRARARPRRKGAAGRGRGGRAHLRERGDALFLSEGARVRLRAPHTYVILFALIVLAALVTHVVPAGRYDRIERGGRRIVDPASY